MLEIMLALNVLAIVWTIVGFARFFMLMGRKHDKGNPIDFVLLLPVILAAWIFGRLFK